MDNTKKELMAEACKIADEHNVKKQAINKILEELDNTKIFGEKHIAGIATIEELMLEMEELEKKHLEVLQKIKID